MAYTRNGGDISRQFKRAPRGAWPHVARGGGGPRAAARRGPAAPARVGPRGRIRARLSGSFVLMLWVDAYFNSKRKHTYNSRLSPPLIEARKCPTFGIAITAAVLLAV